jgi:hypothetical protein
VLPPKRHLTLRGVWVSVKRSKVPFLKSRDSKDEFVLFLRLFGIVRIPFFPSKLTAWPENIGIPSIPKKQTLSDQHYIIK